MVLPACCVKPCSKDDACAVGPHLSDLLMMGFFQVIAHIQTRFLVRGGGVSLMMNFGFFFSGVMMPSVFSSGACFPDDGFPRRLGIADEKSFRRHTLRDVFL